jgi:L-alanine-DL-glutamate epimerase-like enolase superfamily enzyme
MKVTRLDVSAYRIPTDRPEADGTFRWEATTLVLVNAFAGPGLAGMGYSYTSAAAGAVVADLLAPVVIGCPVEGAGQAWQEMVRAVRNVGLPGIAAAAISAVDIALWDLRAKILEMPLFKLLGARRLSAPVYGSGGFTSYREAQLVDQLSAWVQAGIPKVKMKVGKDWGARPEEDIQRIRAVRAAIGAGAELMVDANGAYTARQAVRQAQRFAEEEVIYFEEPVPFERLDQLAFVRKRSPVDVASGEYGYSPDDFCAVLKAGAVDILQADATRCLGVTGCLRAAGLADSFGIPFSTHTAHSVHAHIACAVPQIAHVEYFHDHVRIEDLLFEGVLQPKDGQLYPDPGSPGLGLALKAQAAEKWRI